MIVTFERDIRDQLKELEGDIINSLEQSFNDNEDVKPAFTKILSKISEILYKTSMKHDEWHCTIENNTHNFAFFPGYISNKGRRIFNILFARFNDDGSFDISQSKERGYEKFSLDFWFNQNENNREVGNRTKSLSVLSLAYHFLFLGKSNDITDAFYFSPEVGGTHQWASSVSDEIALNDKLDILQLLAFYDNKKDARHNQIKNQSWINIPFEFKSTEHTPIKQIQDEIYEWCKSVVNKLDYPSNRKEIDRVVNKWPYNPITSADLSKSKIAKLNKYYNQEKDWLVYRAYIIAFWMMFTLSNEKLLSQTKKILDTNFAKAWITFTEYYIEKTKPRRTSEKERCLEFRYSRIIKLVTVLNNSENRDDEKVYWADYKYWYTIPFQHRLDFSPESKQDNKRKETGSAMILTNFMLDIDYFRFVIPWVKKMYNAMREYDTSYITTNIMVEKTNEAMRNAGVDEEKIVTVNTEINFKARNE